MRRRAALTGIVVVMGLALGVSAAMGATKPKFTLTSTAFSNNSTIPVQYTCTGAGMRPDLAWKHAPSGTRQLALIVEDPDAPIGTFVHWVVAGIAPKPASIAGDTEPSGVVGANGTARPGWQPPCPPPGPVHHYFFTLYALKKKVTLPPGGNAATLRAAMKGKIIGQAKLVGLYGT